MSTTMANSDYNAFEVTVNKRLGPVRFLGAYTWSKSLDNSSGCAEIVNFFNPKPSKSLSGFDMTHNFVVSYSYDLPFARPLSQPQRGTVAKYWTAGSFRASRASLRECR